VDLTWTSSCSPTPASRGIGHMSGTPGSQRGLPHKNWAARLPWRPGENRKTRGMQGLREEGAHALQCLYYSPPFSGTGGAFLILVRPV